MKFAVDPNHDVQLLIPLHQRKTSIFRQARFLNFKEICCKFKLFTSPHCPTHFVEEIYVSDFPLHLLDGHHLKEIKLVSENLCNRQKNASWVEKISIIEPEKWMEWKFSLTQGTFSRSAFNSFLVMMIFYSNILLFNIIVTYFHNCTIDLIRRMDAPNRQH